jgi:hypothetical protein
MPCGLEPVLAVPVIYQNSMKPGVFLSSSNDNFCLIRLNCFFVACINYCLPIDIVFEIERIFVQCKHYL